MARAAKPKKEISMEEALWKSADKLRGSVEPAEYKHVVLSLFFLKFASDKFDECRNKIISVSYTHLHTGKVAVGAVIMNRIRDSRFPDSISEVVYQSGQFSPVASGALSRVLSQGAREDCYAAAREALGGSNPVGNSLYFNSGRGKGIQIGNQHFY